ncbi:MAG: TolC family outer membrane protein [Burkholderiales bacterium]|nr:TolC family outer membrane protein [Burkholderiales bacterium]
MAIHGFIHRPRPSPQPSPRGRGSEDLERGAVQSPSSAANHPTSRFTRLAPLALGIVLAFGAASAARAQSLNELYEAARAFDASYLAARALADSAVYKAEQAHGLRRPNVSLNASVNRTGSDLPGSDTTNKSSTAGIAGLQTLFNRANDAIIAQADKGIEGAKADVEAAEQDLIVRVAQAYFDVLASQDALTTATASKVAIAEQLASAKRNFEVGTATITDTREAQARYDLATATELFAQNDLLTKRIALDTLVGRTGVMPHPLAGPVTLAPLLPGTVDEWVGPSDQAPNVRKFRLAYDVAKLETDKARAGNLPTVELAGSYGKGHGNTTGTTLSALGPTPIDSSGPTTQSNIGVTLKLPLYTGGAVQNRVKETLLLEDQSRNNLEAARRAAAQSTRQAYFSLESLQAQVKALEAAESSSLLALEATQLGYKVGVRVNLDVLNAQTQLYTTRRDLAKARYDVLVNSLKLRQAAGTLTSEDVLKVNQLLAK